jgi:DNA-binding transcriptional LysR family regulator
VVCTPDHPLAQNEVVMPEQLMQHHYISREEGSGTREVIDRYLQEAGLSPGMLQIVTEAGSPEALKALIIARMGYAIMPVSSVAREVQLGQLVKIGLAPRLVRQLSGIYPKERIQSRLPMSFLGFAKERLGA